MANKPIEEYRQTLVNQTILAVESFINDDTKKQAYKIMSRESINNKDKATAIGQLIDIQMTNYKDMVGLIYKTAYPELKEYLPNE